MNVKPGETMEDYLVWRLNLIVPSHGDTLVSLGIADTQRPAMPRQRVSWGQFQLLLSHFSPLREMIEQLLSLFERDGGTWDDYHAREFEPHLDEDFEDGCRGYLNTLKRN